jgi:hypothetical protein
MDGWTNCSCYKGSNSQRLTRNDYFIQAFVKLGVVVPLWQKLAHRSGSKKVTNTSPKML